MDKLFNIKQQEIMFICSTYALISAKFATQLNNNKT